MAGKSSEDDELGISDMIRRVRKELSDKEAKEKVAAKKAKAAAKAAEIAAEKKTRLLIKKAEKMGVSFTSNDSNDELESRILMREAAYVVDWLPRGVGAKDATRKQVRAAEKEKAAAIEDPHDWKARQLISQMRVRQKIEQAILEGKNRCLIQFPEYFEGQTRDEAFYDKRSNYLKKHMYAHELRDFVDSYRPKDCTRNHLYCDCHPCRAYRKMGEEILSTEWVPLERIRFSGDLVNSTVRFGGWGDRDPMVFVAFKNWPEASKQPRHGSPKSLYGLGEATRNAMEMGYYHWSRRSHHLAVQERERKLHPERGWHPEKRRIREEEWRSNIISVRAQDVVKTMLKMLDEEGVSASNIKVNQLRKSKFNYCWIDVTF